MRRISGSGSTGTRTASQVAAPIIEGAPALSDADSDGQWTPGEAVQVTLTFSEDVNVDTTAGAPSIGLQLGGTEARSASYASGSGTKELVFSYTLTDADGTHSSIEVTANSLTLNGGTITSDSSGADAASSTRARPGLQQVVSDGPDMGSRRPYHTDGGTSEASMTNRKLNAFAAVTLAILALPLLVACGDGEPSLSRAEVEEIVRAELADAPAATPAAPGITATEVEQIARGVVASIPPRSAPADYTKFFMDNAISRYETQGLDATLAYYNRGKSVDGQWYVFIIDETDLVIGHPDTQRLGLDVKGWVGTDANGYNFGPDMLSATEDGKWVSYVYRNPESGELGAGYTGELELKNAWVVKHDGLLFASGWYVNADDFTKAMVSTAARVFRQVGLEGTIAYFASPESDFAGLAATIGYYNNAANVEGEWFAFISDESGTVIDHYDKTLVGTDLKDLLGTDMFEATAEGNWVTTEDVRVWLVSQDGMTFGSGWRHDASGG